MKRIISKGDDFVVDVTVSDMLAFQTVDIKSTSKSRSITFAIVSIDGKYV